MGSPLQFWENLAPYLSHIEDNFLDLESINKLKGIINDPVLIIGAGQGLLVESLQQCGYKVDGIDNNAKMIEYAERRRGIKLIQEDATKLSFDDNSWPPYLPDICLTRHDSWERCHLEGIPYGAS